MIVEGLVKLKQDDKEIILQNHLTANAAMFLFRMIMVYSIHIADHTNDSMYVHLMRTFQIRLGSGTTQVPLPSLTALQTEEVTLTGNTDIISGDYAIAAPYDKIYSAQVDATTICTAFAGVTITNIVRNVIGFLADPPVAPTTGDIYIVSSPATGDWAGRENDIATYNGSSWDLITPSTSHAISVTGTPNTPYRYNGTIWVEITVLPRECGLFTYMYDANNTYQWSQAGNSSAVYQLGNVYRLAAYICANGANPDFNVGDIDICRSLILEWTLRISFAGDA